MMVIDVIIIGLAIGAITYYGINYYQKNQELQKKFKVLKSYEINKKNVDEIKKKAREQEILSKLRLDRWQHPGPWWLPLKVFYPFLPWYKWIAVIIFLLLLYVLITEIYKAYNNSMTGELRWHLIISNFIITIGLILYGMHFHESWMQAVIVSGNLMFIFVPIAIFFLQLIGVHFFYLSKKKTQK